MGALGNAQTIALQLEKVRDKVPTLFQADTTLWSRIQKKDNVEVVSSRNMRIPLKILSGGKSAQFNPDGGGLGRGSGSTYDVAQVTPVFFSQAREITKQAEIETNNKEKAVENVVKDQINEAMDMLRKTLETLLNSDGSGTLAVITGVSGAVLTVDNANALADGQDVQIWSALGGTQRGSGVVTVLSTDANAKQVTLTANAPTGTIAGDIIVIAGGSATAASSLFGIEYHQVDSNNGTWMSLNRAAYPGKLKTPHINVANNALTPTIVRALISSMKRAMGKETPDVKNLVFHCNLDVEAAWENTGLVVSTVIQNQVGGSNSVDMIKGEAPKTMAGHELLTSIHAKPARLDGLCLDHWGRAEAQPIDYFEVGGQTVFPLYNTDGGLLASSIFYLWTGLQIFNDNPRAGCFADNIAVPQYF